MNEAMKKAWLEVTMFYEDPTEEDFNLFLSTWQRAMQAEREACAKVCDDWPNGRDDVYSIGAAIRARSKT